MTEVQKWHELATNESCSASELKVAALDALGLTGHPKADRLWDLAWEYGHAYGRSEVLRFADDLSDLLR